MLDVNTEALTRERTVHSIGIQMSHLEHLFMQLQNILMLSTLAIGFAADSLQSIVPNLADGAFCMYKGRSDGTGVHLIVGWMLVLLITSTIGIAVIVIAASSFLIQNAQAAALYVSATAAVERTRYWLKRVYSWTTVVMAFFLVSAVLTVWVYIGMPKTELYQNHPADADGDAFLSDEEIDAWGYAELDGSPDLIVTLDHYVYSQCTDLYHRQSEVEDRIMGRMLGILATVLAFFLLVWGAYILYRIRKSFQHDELLDWYELHEASIQKHKAAHMKRRAARAGRAPNAQHLQPGSLTQVAEDEHESEVSTDSME